MSLNSNMYLISFATNLLTILLRSINILFFSSDTLQVLRFGCPSISEICFYGQCHPCYYYLLIRRQALEEGVQENSLKLPQYIYKSSLKGKTHIDQLFPRSYVSDKKFNALYYQIVLYYFLKDVSPVNEEYIKLIGLKLPYYFLLLRYIFFS